MRFALAGMLLAGLTWPAVACNDQLFTVLDWRVDQVGNERSSFSVDVRYDGERGYRMIHAAAMFSDAIGNALVSPGLERDANVAPGDEFTVTESFDSDGLRIATISRQDVRSRICVWNIVYDDGETQRFQ